MKMNGIEKGINKVPGVYRLQNLKTGNFYIGSSGNLYNRYYSHRRLMQLGRHDNGRIQKDLLKYGMGSFVFGVVEYCGKEVMMDREQHYFELWNPPYNVWKNVFSAKGRDYTSEQMHFFRENVHPIRDLESFRQKIKNGWIKRKQSMSPEEFKKKHADARRGIPHSEETKKMLSIQRKGRKKSKEWIEKFRERRRGTKLVNGKYVKINEVF